MQQLFAVVLALVMLPFLLKCRIPSGWAILFLGVFAGIMAGFSAGEISEAFFNVFLNWSSLSSVLTVIQIALLGALMTHYGLFRRAEDALKQVLPAPKVIIMLMPSLIGVLQVPGGAALSAPFCNNIGKEMGLSNSQRSNTNVICRHLFSLFLPFSAWVIQVKDMSPGMDKRIFMLAGMCFTAVNVAGTYLFFLRKARKPDLPIISRSDRLRAFGTLLTVLSPILTVIVLNNIANLPVVLCVPFAILVTYILSDRKHFAKEILQKVNKNLAVMIVGVYFFQNIVKQMDLLMALGSNVLLGSSESVFLLGVAIIAVLFGMATGLIYVSLSVLLPIVASAFSADSAVMTIVVFYVFCWSYIGYMFSPVHMCQLLSDKECGCTVAERYRTYLPMMALLAITSVMLYWIMSLLLC